MNIQSIPTPTQKVTLQERLQAIIHEYTSDDKQLASEYKGRLDELMGLLPEEIESQLLIMRRCKKPLEAYVEAKKREGITKIDELKQRICAEVTLVIYREYIDESIVRICEYLDAHPNIERWGKGAIGHWDNDLETKWASAFYNFWSKKVETGTDKLFRERVVSRLPERHIEKYNCKTRHPYKWHSMSDMAIAGVLAGLKKHCDPAKKRWGIGSLAEWVGPNGEQWGKSFKEYWAQRVEKGTSKKFGQRILAHLPEEWRENFYFRTRCPYDWEKIQPHETAVALQKLKKPKDPAVHKWGLGSICRWTGEEGQPWGTSFFSYWWTTYKDQGPEVFRTEVLQHLPSAWHNNFNHQEYKKWVDMTDMEIADLLVGLLQDNNFEGKRWGLGNMCKLADADGDQVGWQFYQYWRNHVERCDDANFRARILPHMPPSLGMNYKMNGFEFDFQDESDATKELTDSADTVDGLYAIVCDRRSRRAFDKLVILLQDELKTEGDFRSIIERCVHLYVEASGPLLSYCGRSINRARFLYKINKVPYHDPKVQRGIAASVKAANAQDDFDYYLQLLEDSEIDEEILEALTRLLNDEYHTLESIIGDSNIDLALREEARKISKLLE